MEFENKLVMKNLIDFSKYQIRQESAALMKAT